MEKVNKNHKNDPKDESGKSIDISKILKGRKASNAQSYLEELQEKQELFQNRGPGELCITGIATRFIDLDQLINGLQNSQLIILGARPAMGKSALALSIADNIALKNSLPVGIFSLEMTAEQLFHRMICIQSEVESHKILAGSLNGVEYQHIAAAVDRVAEGRVNIDDQPRLTIWEICERARSMKKEHKIELLIIDYIQLIFGVSSNVSVADGAIQYRDLNMHAEVSVIMRELKVLSRELEIPILCLSQLSRKVEERLGHRPMMTDLRDCGAIEEHADVLMFLFRREYYDPYDKPGLAELIVAKNRHGAVGSVYLTYLKEFGKFVNYSPKSALNCAVANEDAFAAFRP